MQPINSKPLVKYGDSFNRIGPNERTVKYDQYKHLEDAILNNGFLPASADITPIHPPYFTEFTYTDVLGGMIIQTFSAEINHRLVNSLDETSYDSSLLNTFIDQLTDKYKLKPSNKKYKKVIFLPGHNIFDKIVDSQKLFQLMDSDEEIVIKPHPITSDMLLRNLGNQFGYNRILEKNVSGYQLLVDCDVVYSVTTSEIPILAMIFGKEYHDITQYMSNWMGALSAITKRAMVSKDPRKTAVSLLLNQDSGFILPYMTEEMITVRINKYCINALKAREPFKMVTSQRLQLQMPHVMSPPPKEVKPNEVQQAS